MTKNKDGGEMEKTRRVLLKLSGEALSGPNHFGFHEETVLAVGRQVKEAVDRGVQLAIVIGGGNFWRGRSSSGTMDRVKADEIGMLATVMNCLYVSEIFRYLGMQTEIYTSFPCNTCKVFSKDAADADLKAGKVVFFAGGTGHPYFSTDTGIVLRAIEMEADMILLAKSVDGVYDSDPAVNPDAKKYDTISIQEVVDRRLGVIDLTASIMCLENHMPLAVFGMEEANSITNALNGIITGTVITA